MRPVPFHCGEFEHTARYRRTNAEDIGNAAGEQSSLAHTRHYLGNGRRFLVGLRLVAQLQVQTIFVDGIGESQCHKILKGKATKTNIAAGGNDKGCDCIIYEYFLRSANETCVMRSTISNRIDY